MTPGEEAAWQKRSMEQALKEALKQAQDAGFPSIPGLDLVLQALASLVSVFALASATISGTEMKKLAQWSEAQGKHSLYDLETLYTGFVRGEIDEGTFVAELAKQGYDQEHIVTIEKLLHILPPIQDIVHFAVREVWTPGVRA